MLSIMPPKLNPVQEKINIDFHIILDYYKMTFSPQKPVRLTEVLGKTLSGIFQNHFIKRFPV